MKRLISALVLALVCHSASNANAQNGIATATPNRVVGRVNDLQRVTLKGNVHPLARRQFDRGAAPASAPTGRLRLVLRRSEEQQRELTQLLEDLQNPASPSYHKWLTPAEYAENFGVSESDLVQVETWLQSHGFKIEKVPQARNAIEFSGTLDQVQKAFHTPIHTFEVNGETYVANTADPEIPAALAQVVAAVGPLHDFRPKPLVVRGPDGRYDSSTGRILPELTLSGGNNNLYLFVDPADAAIIYNIPNKALNPSYTGTTYDGSGISIGIAGVSDLITGAIANYRTGFLGESSGAENLPTVVVDGNKPDVNGASIEALLDTEVAGGIAPKAKIYFYTSDDTDLSSGLLNAIFRALDDNTVSILSVSFGSCEAAAGQSGNQTILEAAQQAAAQGISVTVSSGDNGSAGCDDFNTQSEATHGFGVNAFASTPYNVAVGGTDFDVLSSAFSTYVNSTTSGAPPYYATALKYIPENPWNDSTTVNTSYANNIANKNGQGVGNIIAGSGGLSSVYAKPSFQSSLTPQDGARDVPDVSLLAGNGMYHAAWVICADTSDCLTSGGQFTSNTRFGGAGGTSASAPAFAGMLALVAQAHGSASDNHRLGQADSVLYQLAHSKYSRVFHDVTTGNNSVACSAGSSKCGSNGFLSGYNAGNGYDLASGLGSVDAAAMVNNWTSVSLGSTTTSLKINGATSAYTGVHGASLKFDVSVSPGSATGVAGIVDNADANSGGTVNNGQIAIPLSGGTGSANYNGLPGGSYSVWARYGGDTSNASSTSTPAISVNISPEDSSTTLAVHAYDRQTGLPISTTNIPFGSYVIANAGITGTAEGSNTQGVATGTVSFVDGSSTAGTAEVSAGNQASWPPLTNNIQILSGGSHQLVAQYSGDSSFKASSSQPVSFNIVPAKTTLQVQSTNYTMNSSQSAVVLFDIYSPYVASVPPGGTASLILNNTVLATATNLSSAETGGPGTYEWETFGNFTIQASQLQPGLNTLIVTYSGDSNYGRSIGTVAIDVIAPGGGVTLTAPASVSIGPSSNASFASTVTLTSSGGYTGWINWSCSAGALSCWIPEAHAPLSASADTLLVISGNVNSGTYTVNVEGTDNSNDGIDIKKTVQVTVSASATPGVAVMNNGPLTVSAGASTGNTSLVSIIPSAGLTGQVNLSCAVMTAIADPQSSPTCTVPASITISDANPVTAQVEVNTTSATTTGSYNVAVTAVSASNSAVTTTGAVPLTVTASPSFSLSNSGIVRAAIGVVVPNAATVTIMPVNGFTGPVNLSCFVESAFVDFGHTLPECSVPSSVKLSAGTPATVNISLKTNLDNPATSLPGFYLMTVSAVAAKSSTLGFDTSLDLLLGATPSFSLSNSGNITVSAGATTGNTATVTLNPTNGFTGNVNLSCKVSTSIVNPNDPPGCSLSPAQVSVTGSAAVTSKLTVTTTAPTSGAVVPAATPFRVGATIPVLALLFLFGISSKRRRWMRLLGGLVLVLWLGAAGCGGGGGTGPGGGGGGNPGTTAGSYSVTVTATDAATGKITSQTGVTVTVN